VHKCDRIRDIYAHTLLEKAASSRRKILLSHEATTRSDNTLHAAARIIRASVHVKLYMVIQFCMCVTVCVWCVCVTVCDLVMVIQFCVHVIQTGHAIAIAHVTKHATVHVTACVSH